MRPMRELERIAVAAAREAGEMIARSRPHDIQHKPGDRSAASQVVTEVDRRSEEIILDHLRPTLEPDRLGLLTEEQDDDGSRLSADHFWCIDPLDGTLPFVEGKAGYSVSIALVRRDGMPVIGVVHDPVRGTTWQASAGSGVRRDGVAWHRPAPADGPLAVFVDPTLLDAVGETFANQLERVGEDLDVSGVELRTGMGAVLKACAVLGNAPAAYIKFPKPSGGGSLWDFAATACLFHEAGAVATDIHGDPLDLNRADSTFMNHRGVLYATDERIASALRSLH